MRFFAKYSHAEIIVRVDALSSMWKNRSLFPHESGRFNRTIASKSKIKIVQQVHQYSLLLRTRSHKLFPRSYQL